jgi:hypothetical protein
MNSQEFDILSREIESLKQQLASGITVPQKFDRLNKTTTLTGDTTGLIVGTIVTWTGTAWEAADQDTLNPEDQIGVVISQSSTRITVVLWGNFILDPADVDDQTAYYLDPDNPGEFTDTPADTLVFRCAENGECFIATAGGGSGSPAVLVGSTEYPDGKALYLNDCQSSNVWGTWLKSVGGPTTQKDTNWLVAIAGPTIEDSEFGNYSLLYLRGLIHYPSHGFTKPQVLSVQYDEYYQAYSAILSPQTKNAVMRVGDRVVLIPRGPDDFYFDGMIPGNEVPGALDTGEMYAKNADDPSPTARMDPELGVEDTGGGRLKVFTDPNKQVDIVQTGHIQATRSSTVFDYLHVNVITDSATVPTGAGVKGQIHVIY